MVVVLSLFFCLVNVLVSKYFVADIRKKDKENCSNQIRYEKLIEMFYLHSLSTLMGAHSLFFHC